MGRNIVPDLRKQNEKVPASFFVCQTQTILFFKKNYTKMTKFSSYSNVVEGISHV